MRGFKAQKLYNLTNGHLISLEPEVEGKFSVSDIVTLGPTLSLFLGLHPSPRLQAEPSGDRRQDSGGHRHVEPPHEAPHGTIDLA